MKKLIFFAIIFSTPAFAQKISIDVPGMVCQMCVQGMKKIFKDVVADSEKDIVVDLDAKKVVLNVTKEITDSEIEKRVQSAGYNAESITR